jgi:hypothetical protein
MINRCIRHIALTPARFGIVHVATFIGKWFPVDFVIQRVNILEIEHQAPWGILAGSLLAACIITLAGGVPVTPED